jgi:penicillin-insensitive murein DD-endopeptidase
MVHLLLVMALSNPWSMMTTPAAGRPEPLGSYSAGCLQGSQHFPRQDDGYQLLRPSQHRDYGHPILINYLHELVSRAQAKGLPPLLIGDMAMVRGGPFTSGHKSHQNGLDVDIWFRFAQPRLSKSQLEKPTPLDMVKTDNQYVSAAFTDKQRILLQLAATDPRVERIFVHPAIKRALCEQTTGDRSWLHRIRPWFGHRAHLHVRLRCPNGAYECKPQKPIPAGDGCGAELMSWFSGPTEVSTSSKPQPLPELPARCNLMLPRH